MARCRLVRNGRRFCTRKLENGVDRVENAYSCSGWQRLSERFGVELCVWCRLNEVEQIRN